MGQRYRDLRQERDNAVKALEGFISRMHLSPGDLVVFKVDPKSIGTSFGIGWGCMDNLSNMMSKMAGGPVRCLATTDRNPFDVTQLDATGRAKLRALLDQLDRQALERRNQNPFDHTAREEAGRVTFGRSAIAPPR